MDELIRDWFPHGYCLAWDWRLIAADVLGDLSTGVAYFLLPFAIAVAAKAGKLDRIITRGNWWMWVTFIAFCGVTHLLGPVAIWQPIYVAVAFAKICTGAVSLWTVWTVREALAGRTA